MKQHNDAPDQSSDTTLPFPVGDGHEPFDTVIDQATQYLLLSGTARGDGNHELGERFRKHGLELLNEHERLEASAAVEVAWNQFQELLRSNELAAAEVFRVNLGQNLSMLPDYTSGLSIAAVRRLLTGQPSLDDIEAEHLMESVTRYTLPMEGGYQYRETHDSTPGSGSLIAIVEKLPTVQPS